VPTGFKTQQTAEAVLGKLLEESEITFDDINYIVGTGYGRIALEFGETPNQVLTEISCHAMGAHALSPNTRSIIDIGWQDSKAIKVDNRRAWLLFSRSAHLWGGHRFARLCQSFTACQSGGGKGQDRYSVQSQCCCGEFVRPCGVRLCGRITVIFTSSGK